MTLFVKSITKNILIFLLGIPKFNIIIQYILRPINKHKQIILAALKDISYSKILDYGCGEGLFSGCFCESKYIGYDPAVKKIIYAKKRFVYYQFLSENPNFRIFDLFFFNNVLHHMNQEQVGMLIKNVSKSTKRNTHLMIIELKPIHQQTSYIYKLILFVESKIHYSEPRSVNFYKHAIKNNGFDLIYEKDLDIFYLLLFKK